MWLNAFDSTIANTHHGFLADTEAFGAAQLAHFERHAVDEIGVFGGRKVIEQALAEALDVGGKLPATPVKHGAVD